TVSFSNSNSPPVLGSGLEVGTVQITNFAGATAYLKDNVDSADAHTYIEPDKVLGQIFTTGSDPSGYKLMQVSYRTPTYGNGFSSMGGFTYSLRVINPPTTAANASSNNNTNILATETAEVGYGPNSPGAINILDGANGRITQNGTWITYTFDN